MSNHNSGKAAILAAAGANIVIAISKLAAWLVTGASSLLAESIHSFADTGNQVLLLISGRKSRKAADAEHPFGYGPARYLGSFLVSIVLFTLGGLFALYEAWHKFEQQRSGEPDQLLTSNFWWVPLAVLGFAILAESFSLRTALKESASQRAELGFWGFIRGSKAPELPVVLLEDLAALIGLVLALAGVGLTLITGNGIFDVIGTAAIGVLLVVVAVILGRESLSLIVGESASAQSQKAITTALLATSGVERIIHLRTLHIGPEEIMVAAKIAVEPTESAAHIAQIIDQAEANVRAAEPWAIHMFVEPDIYRG